MLTIHCFDRWMVHSSLFWKIQQEKKRNDAKTDKTDFG